jgi:predicted nuclease with RNAse H fold
VTRKQNVVVGLDLAGSPKRPTGFCLLRGADAETSDLFADSEILEAVRKAAPALVAIDAPLNLPPGRTSIHERNDSHYRVCDLELRKRRIPFFPITLGPMRSLTERGIGLRCEIEAMGIRVIEMYPGGAQDVWRIPRARRDRVGLRRGLLRLGLKGLRKDTSDHELDAATGALVGRDFLAGKAEVYGNFEEGAIVMPAVRPAVRKKRAGTSSRPGGSEGRPSGSPAAGPGTQPGPGRRGTRH